MRKFYDNFFHYTAIAIGIAFFVKGFLPLSKLVVNAAPLPAHLKQAYNA